MTRRICLIISGLILFCLCLSCTKAEFKVDNFPLQETGLPDKLSPQENRDEVVLAIEDSVTVSVWGQDNLTRQVTVDSEGYIHYPLINKIKSAGLTINELQEKLSVGLSRYYVNPDVTINPVELSGQRYFVLGEVYKPGKFILNNQISILEAVSFAGGMNTDAGDYVVLLRKQKNELLVYSVPLSYDKLTVEHITSVTMQIHAGDVLYVAPGDIVDVERFMKRINNILNPLLAIERGVLYWPALVNAINGSSGKLIINP